MALTRIMDRFGRETSLLDDGTSVPCRFCGKPRVVPLVPVGKSGRLVRFIPRPCGCDGYRDSSLPPAVREVERKPQGLRIPAAFSGRLPDVSAIVEKIESGRWVYLFGSFGTGKSAAAWATADAFHKRGRRCVVAHLADVMAAMSSARSFGSDMDEVEAFSRFADAGLIVLDDLGKEPATAANVAMLWRLVDHRWERGLPCLFTSNHKLSALMEKLYDADSVTTGAIESRLLSSCDLVPMIGRDLRNAS